MAEQTTQTPTTEETKTPETTSTTNLPGSKTIEKIASIPAVTSIFESAKSLYSAAKDYSPLVKSSLETVEASVDSTVKFVKPNVVDPLLNSQTYKKYAEPTLTQVDEFGVKSIETIEKLPENLNATYQHSKEAVETKVSQITTSTLNTVEQKVTAVDTYLKGSVIGAPMEKAIDVTEKLVDQYLVEKKTITEETQTSSEEKEITTTTTDGPLLKAGKLSKKIQHQAFEKLKKLSLRSNESVKSMEYVVDLIQYAANHLDSGVKTTQTFLNQKGGEIAAKSTEMLEEKKKQLHEAKDSLQKSTQDALAAVVVVAKEVAKQTKEFPEKTYHALEERVGEWKLNMESITDMSMFHSVATKSLEKLNEIKNTVVSSGSTLPASVTESVSKGLHAILDSLMSLGGEKKEATKESKEEFTPQPAPVD